MWRGNCNELNLKFSTPQAQGSLLCLNPEQNHGCGCPRIILNVEQCSILLKQHVSHITFGLLFLQLSGDFFFLFAFLIMNKIRGMVKIGVF